MDGGTFCADLKYRLMEKFILCRKIKNLFLKLSTKAFCSARGGVRALCQGYRIDFQLIKLGVESRKTSSGFKLRHCLQLAAIKFYKLEILSLQLAFDAKRCSTGFPGRRLYL